jgi:AraC-like DNA-binding protein
MHTATREVTFDELLIPASEFADPATPSFKLCLVLEGEADLTYRIDDRPRTVALRPGMFAPVTPPSVDAQLGISAAQRHLMIEVSAAAVQRATGRSDADLGALHVRPFRSTFLTRLCTQALREHRAGDTLGAAFVEASQTLLVLALLRLAHGTAPAIPPHRPSALPAAVVERIRRHCEAHLDQPIIVDDLAAIAGLGAHQFARSFKAAAGRSPRQFVIALRVGHAMHLLSSTRLPVAEIALRCGFFDQAHLASTFARVLATSPSRYRSDSRA